MKHDSLKEQRTGPNSPKLNLSNCKHCIIDCNFNLYVFMLKGFYVINNLI